MREVVQKTVDGRLYEFEQFSTTVALKTLSKLTKLLGEPIVLALGAIKKTDAAKAKKGDKVKTALDTDLSDLDTAVLGQAVRSLIDRMEENEVVELVKQLTSVGLLCDHKPVLFDEHYRGETSHLFKVLSASLSAQYGNFLGAVTARFPAAAAMANGPVSLRK